MMVDRNPSTGPASRSAIGANVVALPGAAIDRVRQPRGGVARVYRKANPWPGRWFEAVDEAALAFKFAYHGAEVARARWKLAEAVASEDWALGREAEREASGDHRWLLLDALRVAIERLAATPAPDTRKLRAKVQTIGNIWLGSEGEWYDQLRASIARDAERLGVRNPAPIIPRRR